MLGGAALVGGAEFRAAQYSAHLYVKVSIGLGGGPDGKKQVGGVYGGHAPGGDPAVDHRHLSLHQRSQFGGEQGFKHGGAVQQLVGKHLGGMGALGRQRHFVADVALDGGAWVGLRQDAAGGLQPVLQRARQHRPVEGLLATKVIVQVGLGQAGRLGNGGHGGAAKAGAGKNTFGGGHDPGLVVLPDLALGQSVGRRQPERGGGRLHSKHKKGL